VAYHLGLVMQSEGARLSDLAESRLLIEPACAGLAAGRDEHEAIATELAVLIDESELLVGESSVDFTASAQRFHQTIVERCGNVTMRLMAGVLEAVWDIQEARWAEQAAEAGSYPDPPLQRAVVTAHRRVNRYIQRGDASGATRAMRSHLEHSQPFVDPKDSPVQVVLDSRPAHSVRPAT
jgi:GntR family transcriptional repressor for pyruvate dehydrogenase complex